MLRLATAGTTREGIAAQLGIGVASVYRILRDHAEAMRETAVKARKNRRDDPGAAADASLTG